MAERADDLRGSPGFLHPGRCDSVPANLTLVLSALRGIYRARITPITTRPPRRLMCRCAFES